MSIKIGVPQLKAPTPAKVNNIVGGISTSLGVFMLWLGTQRVMSTHVANDIEDISGLFLSLIHVVRPFFGVQVPINEKSVPIEDVTAMKDVEN